MLRKTIGVILGGLGILVITTMAGAAEYYVDSQGGDDTSDGTTATTAWRSLDRVNSAKFQPGDVVRFRRIPALESLDCMYRGTFRPQSGAEGQPIQYTWYGDETDPKPIFCRSVSLHRQSDWLPVDGKEHLWKTRSPEFRQDTELSIFEGDTTEGGHHTEGGAQAKFTELTTDTDSGYLIAVTAAGTATNHIQWYTKPFAIEKGRAYRVTFRFVTAEAPTSPLKPITVSLMKSGSPWTGYSTDGARQITPQTAFDSDSGDSTLFNLYFVANDTATDARINFSLGGLSETPVALELGAVNVYPGIVEGSGITTDVGNLILAKTPRTTLGAETSNYFAGWKKWNIDDLTTPGDFWCDLERRQVYLYCEQNPAAEYTMVEAALHGHVVSHNNLSYAIFDGLDIRFGGAHGFGGTNASHVIIRNCDISWIGGADQYLQGGTGRKVRFGNGIEFWASSHDNLVEHNRIWEIYDAAITNQGSESNREENLTYRENEIWNSEYSFEFWNRGPESVTTGIVFERNRCRNAGFGWGHIQRPDKNGRHVMFYNNSSQTSNFRVTDNVFTIATESLLRMDNDWTSGLTLDRNTWICDDQTPIAWWMTKQKFYRSDFDVFQEQTSYETNGTTEKL